MIDSGCNTALIPFPEESIREDIFGQFLEDDHEWTIASSVGNGTIHCPVLKITNYTDSTGVMNFPTFKFQVPMPFIRFHLGSEACRWILAEHPRRIGPAGRQALRSFLQTIGDDQVEGRTIALLGQMLLQNLCVFQFGKIMFLMKTEKADKLLNPMQIARGCIPFARHYVAEYEDFHDLHDTDVDLYDQDGDMPEEAE